MNQCEHFSEGKCLAFKKINGWQIQGNDIAVHVPKFCAIDEEFIGDETQPKRRIQGRCTAGFSEARQCGDFKEIRPWGLHY